MIDTGLRVGLTLFGVVMALTAYGIYVAFGPPGKELEDPIDHHDD